ncbi:hypothetical protein, partial [Pseudomonas aeruginosa]
NEMGDNYSAKLPFDLLRLRLKELGNRGAIRLAALKIYVILIARRSNKFDWTALTYEKLVKHTGVLRADIAAS